MYQAAKAAADDPSSGKPSNY